MIKIEIEKNLENVEMEIKLFINNEFFFQKKYHHHWTAKGSMADFIHSCREFLTNELIETLINRGCDSLNTGITKEASESDSKQSLPSKDE
jgi:hypothetical protein